MDLNSNQVRFIPGLSVKAFCLAFLLAFSQAFPVTVFARQADSSGSEPVTAKAVAVSTLPDETLADDLVEFVGLTAQIERTAGTIVSETLAALQACENPARSPDEMKVFLESLYSPEALAGFARKQMNSGLTLEDKLALREWISSPLGDKIHAAESALQDVNSDTLAELESRLQKSDEWTDVRQQHIYRTIRVTRVHHYVAALNSALSAAVTMASSCKTDFGTLNGLEIAHRKDRGDEKLVAMLMVDSFIVPTGVILKPLSNAELHDYLLFSVSPVGKKWYALVIDTVRAMIEERIPAIRGYIETPAGSAVTGSLNER